ncbi:redoxin domain-containing protein [bacterium]|nr:redoxin domain-containing protein [bacterium]
MLSIRRIRVLTITALAAVLLAGVAGRSAEAAPSGARVGEQAPAFSLTDLSGNTVSLADYAGKTVVLEWFNPGCPYVVAYYEGSSAMQDLKARIQSPSVVWLAINSGAPGKEGADPELNREKAGAWGIQNPVLLDSDGKVGKAYGARRTPEIVVIDPSGVLVYRGAADEGGINGEPGSGRAFVEEAVKAAQEGNPPSIVETRPVGCGVKYAN